MTDLERQMLALEKRRYVRAGAKEAAIKAELGMSATRYYQVLSRLIHTQEALAAEPVLVKRLLRIAEKREA